MALAEALHHSSGTTPSKRDTRVVEGAKNDAKRGQKTVTRAREGEVREEHLALHRRDFPRRMRPALLVDVQPQGCVERHVVEHMADVCPVVQTLDAPMPQLVDTVLEFFRALTCRLTSRSSQCPRSPLTVSRSVWWSGVSLRWWNSWWKCRRSCLILRFLQRTVEQTVDNPASRGRGRSGGLQGFFPGQSTTAAAVDIPVPRGDLQGFLPGQVSTASSSHSPDAENEAGIGVFRTFRRGKKVRRPQPSRVRSCPPVSARGRGRLVRAEMEDDAEPLIEEEEDPSGWSVAPSASGRPFFWHRISRRSVWKLPPGASVRRRKRKKRRKRRTPRSPRPLLRARARCRQRQWHVSGFPCDVSPRAVFPSVDGRPKMLDVVAGVEQKNSYVLLFSAPRTVFPSLSSGPRCSASWPVWTRRISACARLGLLVFDDVFSRCAPLGCLKPKMPVIMAGVDHRTVM